MQKFTNVMAASLRFEAGVSNSELFWQRLRELRRLLYRVAPFGKDATVRLAIGSPLPFLPCQCSRRKLRLVRNSLGEHQAFDFRPDEP